MIWTPAAEDLGGPYAGRNVRRKDSRGWNKNRENRGRSRRVVRHVVRSKNDGWKIKNNNIARAAGGRDRTEQTPTDGLSRPNCKNAAHGIARTHSRCTFARLKRRRRPQLVSGKPINSVCDIACDDYNNMMPTMSYQYAY